MPNKYKVTITETSSYIIDVLAKDEDEAIKLASAKFSDLTKDGIQHYYQEDQTVTTIGTIYNVTDTDDPFNP